MIFQRVSTDSGPSQELPPGTRLEEFIIERVLGSGGFGITYLATDKRLGRQVVIKENLPAQFCWRDTTTLTVQPRQSSGEDADNFQYSLESFEKEAATLASLDHPGIVKVLRSFEANGTAYFVMPFVEGTTFDEVIREREALNRSFTEEELIALLHKVLDALAYLHDRGIYHRDIKPGNILITKIGTPVLIDFGAARQRLSERSLTVIESPGFTPFEQMQSRGKVGPWSDFYALSGTMYKAITGETPAKAADRILEDALAPLAQRRELEHRFSKTLLQSIDRAMRPKLSERPQSTEEWARNLRALAPPMASESPSRRKVGAATAPSKVGTRPERALKKGTAVNVAVAMDIDDTSREAFSRTDFMWMWGGVCVILLLLVWFSSQLSNNAASDPSEIVAVATAPPPTSEPIHVPTPNMLSALEGGEAGESLQIEIGLGQKMAFQFCSAGSFMMGSPAGEINRGDDENQVQVRISQGFWMGQTEVTQRQWAAVMASNPSQFEGDELPVEQVSWEDAQKFIGKLNQGGGLPEGWKYALPTEAQWEYACRACRSTAFGFGDSLSSQEANFDGGFPYGNAVKGSFGGKTSLVGSYKPNAWGLYDMHGNVYEWCADWYAAALEGGTDPVGASKGSVLVLRGGSWLDNGDGCRSAKRRKSAPDDRNYFNGFRVAAVREAGAAPETSPEVAPTLVVPAPVPVDLSTTDELIPLEGDTAGQSIQLEINQGERMTFNFCPAGSFMMGSPTSERNRRENENQVQVRISQGFWMGQTEVTQRQWAAVMGSNPSSFKGDGLPVEQVSWEDAQAFIAKLNQSAARLGGWKYALPSEAQWEYACRAGRNTPFGIGESLSSHEANFDGNYPYGTTQKGPYLGKTANVGSYAANAWGLYDMHGNVWEWCADWYGEKLSGGVDPVGAATGSNRVFRGGSWTGIAQACRAAYRFIFTPGYRDRYLGFRVAAVQAGATASVKETEPLLLTFPAKANMPVQTSVDTSADINKSAQTAVDAFANTSKTVPFKNTLGMAFVPAGTPEVLFSVWETRVKDFEAFVQETGHDAIGDSLYGASAYTVEKTADGKSVEWAQKGGTWKDSGFPTQQTDEHPVVCVSYLDAEAFCAWMTTRDRAAGVIPQMASYRLPTDNEWSQAVGGSEFPWGESFPPSSEDGNYIGEEAMVGALEGVLNEMVKAGRRDSAARTAPVGMFKENRFGLYDMGGNVSEWCSTWYIGDLNDAESKEAFPSLKTAEGGQTYRVLRGASWYNDDRVRLRSSFRRVGLPMRRDHRNGFRCVLVVSGG